MRLVFGTTITIEEFKERNASVMKTRWVDTEHGSAGEKIYELYDSENQGELVKESFQEWLCDNCNEVTQCIVHGLFQVYLQIRSES